MTPEEKAKIEKLITELRVCSGDRERQGCSRNSEVNGCDRLEADAADTMEQLLETVLNYIQREADGRLAPLPDIRIGQKCYLIVYENGKPSRVLEDKVFDLIYSKRLAYFNAVGGAVMIRTRSERNIPNCYHKLGRTVFVDPAEAAAVVAAHQDC